MSENHYVFDDQDKLFLSLLERLRNGDEGHALEAKKGGAIDTSIMETVCAFSNEPGMGGGFILLGVVRDEDQLFPDYQVVGVPDPDKIQSDLASQCADRFNTAVRPRISTASIGGKTVLIVEVPEAQVSEKPVFFKNKGLPKGAYRRIGSSDQTCTEDDIFLLYQGRGHKAYEDLVLDELSIDLDISEEGIQSYRQRRERINPAAPELSWSKEELLYALGAAYRNKNGAYSPTMCGLLCFGKDTAYVESLPWSALTISVSPGERGWKIPTPDSKQSKCADHYCLLFPE